MDDYILIDSNNQLKRKIKRKLCLHKFYIEKHVLSNDNRKICSKCGIIKPTWKGQKI